MQDRINKIVQIISSGITADGCKLTNEQVVVILNEIGEMLKELSSQ